MILGASPLRQAKRGPSIRRAVPNVADPEKALRGGPRAGRVAAESRALRDGPSVVEAWGENALCLPDRNACGAERLLKLPRCFVLLLPQCALPRHVPAPVRVLRRSGQGMRKIRNE